VDIARFDHRKYRAFQPIAKPDRRWPDQVIRQAPQWCSVDLRDGNQALVEPMNAEQKLRLWELLVTIGFKQIEVGFPSASSHDFAFLRKLIEENRIPDDVTVQVLTQARPDLIEKTFAALEGVRRAWCIFTTAPPPCSGNTCLARSRRHSGHCRQWRALVKEAADARPETEWVFEYSPESFTGTEMDFAVSVCDAVNEVLAPTPERPVIINLPATVEMSTPNIYADQIEWFCDHVKTARH
jgi:2-isopropylmalate synthase